MKFRMVLNTVGFFAGVSFFYAFTYFFCQGVISKIEFCFWLVKSPFKQCLTNSVVRSHRIVKQLIIGF